MQSFPDKFGSQPGLRRLKMFDAVVRCGTISRAAVEIGLSQPSMTLGLAKLESEVGESLMTRGPGGSSPTAAGMILHRRVERMLRMIENAAARLFEAQDARKAAVVVRNLSGRQVRDHLAVDATGSFHAAAAALGVAAPTLNRSVQQLRQMVGTPLYRRTPSGFTTTAAGVLFASELRVALGEIDQALEELAAARGATKGRISIGCLPLMPKLFLEEVINALICQFPGIEISLQEDAYDPLAQALRSGDVDVVLGALRRRRDGEFQETLLFPDPYVLVVRRDHPLPSGSKLTATQLAQFSWAIPWRNTPRREVVERIFAHLRQRPHVVIETSSLSMTRAVLTRSDCVTLLAQSQVASEGGDDQLRTLQVQAAERKRIVGVTSRRDWLPTPAQSAFLQHLVTMGRDRAEQLKGASRDGRGARRSHPS